MKSVIMPLRSINTQSQKVATIQGSSTIVKLQTKPVLIGSLGSESKILKLTHLTRLVPSCLCHRPSDLSEKNLSTHFQNRQGL